MLRTFASLFSGGGGWDAGAIDAGLSPVFAVEMNEEVSDWYRTVFGPHVVTSDVSDVDWTAVTRKLEAAGTQVDVLFSSPPCQATSLSGMSQKARRAARSLPPKEDRYCNPTVGLVTIDAVRALRPKVVFVENNEGYQETATFKSIVRGLSQLGYQVDYAVVNATDYGVASGRKRLILRAARWLPPWPLRMPKVPWDEAIGDLIESMPKESLAPWQARALAKAPFPSGHAVLIAGGNPTKVRHASAPKGYVYRVWRLEGDKAWATQRAQNTSGMRVIDRHGVVRRLSTRAIARLQGFPDHYPIEKLDRVSAINVLGNSVPPILSRAMVAQFQGVS